MLDKIEMRIPVDSSLVEIREDGKYCIFGFDLLDLSIRFDAMEVYKDDEGEKHHQVLRHPYSRLPTSYTKMAFKFVHEGTNYPYVELKCSPAKILQGHNVFGTDLIKEGAFEMLGWLLETHPDLYSMLHIESTEIMVLDVTYSARLKDDETVAKVLSFMRNFSGQYTRKSKHSVIHKNTVYFGSERAKWLQRKLYGKYIEFMEQLEEQRKLAKKNDKAAERVVAVMEDPRLQQWAQGLLRIETGMKKAWLQKLSIPTNLFQLIKFQELNPNFLQQLWLKANDDMFKALEGQTMKLTDHESVYSALLAKFTTITPSGRKSITKARNLFNFYCGLEMHGCEAMKKRYCERQYYQHFGDLVKSGLFSRIFLQNLHSDSQTNVIPFIKLVEIKFEEQVPDWFVEPVSTFRFKNIA
ncbi:phage/plasmid replication protein, II/X family [Acinetobacter soli]|nr:phage/plasmid replication protein, II/X family [Acinetobacter soli]WEI14009.1 phage/plasmid replication protein, II/X family [Acinetobacter soli]WEI14016.1 phage/plasmid replication protein, II/X family [Acinetobacter soli]WEI14022.1 phage/plasmid replication protein, II/X family [Acinetobacter soli]WEI14028.1 phage/plasmid replication protein, II/X family [Acinetobacter soli]WEI15672.1 phage/plasmid replication protein, II/X family [Acinetobacter soli]